MGGLIHKDSDKFEVAQKDENPPERFMKKIIMGGLGMPRGMLQRYVGVLSDSPFFCCRFGTQDLPIYLFFKTLGPPAGWFFLHHFKPLKLFCFQKQPTKRGHEPRKYWRTNCGSPSKWPIKCRVNGVILTTYDTWDDLPNTLPETNPLHLKMDGWKTIFFLFGWLILGRCELLDLKSVKNDSTFHGSRNPQNSGFEFFVFGGSSQLVRPLRIGLFGSPFHMAPLFWLTTFRVDTLDSILQVPSDSGGNFTH